MRSLNNKIGVVFQESDKKTYDLGNGIELLRATSWVAREDDGDVGTKKMTNVNHLEVNPQIATLTMVPEGFLFEVGDLVFLNYLAYESTDELIDPDGLEFSLIDASYVMFKMEGGEYILPKGYYLAESIVEEAPKTSSGIFLTSQESEINPLKVKIVNVGYITRQEENNSTEAFKIGDTVITLDANNYPIEVEGKKYLFLKEHEIVGLCQE